MLRILSYSSIHLVNLSNPVLCILSYYSIQISYPIYYILSLFLFGYLTSVKLHFCIWASFILHLQNMAFSSIPAIISTHFLLYFACKHFLNNVFVKHFTLRTPDHLQYYLSSILCNFPTLSSIFLIFGPYFYITL